MTTIIIDGRVTVSWLTAVANINAPTVAELNAGTRLEGFITPDGLDISTDTSGVDNSNLGSNFTTNRAGRRKPAVSITYHHQTPVDTPYNLFPYRTLGYLAVRRSGIDKTTPYASGQPLKIYPLEAGESNDSKPAPDSNDDFTVPYFVTDDPATRAVVA